MRWEMDCEMGVGAIMHDGHLLPSPISVAQTLHTSLKIGHMDE